MEEALKHKDSLIHEYREECDSWERKYKELENSHPTESNLIKLLDKLTNKMEDNTKAINLLLARTNKDNTSNALQTEVHQETVSEGLNITYSKALTQPRRNNQTWHSKSAILLKRRPTTKMSLNYIRNILNKETKDMSSLPKIYCESTRD